jgi:hypothetical protein
MDVEANSRTIAREPCLGVHRAPIALVTAVGP